jgi:oligoendopeptidase F
LQGSSTITTKSNSQPPIWDLSRLYTRHDDPVLERDYAEVETKSKAFEEAVQSSIEEDQSSRIFNLLNDYEIILEKFSLIFAYSHLSMDTDLQNPVWRDLSKRVQKLGNTFSTHTQSFIHELSHLSNEELDDLLATLPLAHYQHFFRTLKKGAKFLLSELEEKVIRVKNMNGVRSWSQFYTAIETNLNFGKIRLKDETIILSKSKIKALSGTHDPKLRFKVQKQGLQTYGKQAHALAHCFNSIVSDYQSELHQLRQQDSILTSTAHQEDLGEESILSLFETTRQHYGLFRDYHLFKKNALGLKTYRNTDLSSPLIDGDFPLSYETAIQNILESLRGFDSGYALRGEQILNESRIHSKPDRNKKTGAYCMGTTKGPFILSNFENNYDSAFTLAHELGHGLHFSYAFETQPPLLRRGTLTGAETASQFNEFILLDYYLKQPQDPKLKLMLLDLQVGSMISVLFRQSLISNFELECHRKARNETLTQDFLDQTWLKMISERNGKNIQTPEFEKHGWCRIPHIFHYPFYCWTYSMSLMTVLGLYQCRRTQGKSFVKGYLNLLKAGGSMQTQTLLKDCCGINILSPNFYHTSFSLVADWLEELKTLHSKIVN